MNELFDKMSDFLAKRPGLLPLLGILLIFINLVLQIFPADFWVIRSNIFLHIGLIIGFIGILLVKPLQ
ncbi:MAG: hypothetical protein QNJ45_03525 [Ardenticatenaceae bacterium]|nr:hypothetical protein [Ardenticatenaceae bacterium]